MYIEIDKSDKNTGKVDDLIDYLEKENNDKIPEEKEAFFSQDQDNISPEKAKEMINNNTAKLANDRVKNGTFIKGERKYYSIYIAPSEKELNHINNNAAHLKSYVRSIMEQYAENFDKGISGSDLVYVAKVEHERKMKGFDQQVMLGFAKQGDIKQGHNMHVHIVVSRRIKNNGGLISPLANEKKSTSVRVGKNRSNKGIKGFNRKNWIISSEQKFDSLFNYDRAVEESFEYRLAHKQKGIISKYIKPTTKLEKSIYSEYHFNNALNTINSKDAFESKLSQRGIKVLEHDNELKVNYQEEPVHTISSKNISNSELKSNAKKLNSFYPEVFKKLPLMQQISKEINRINKEQEKDEEKEI